MSLSFDSYPLWVNLIIFTVATGLIWFAGIRLEYYSTTISERTGLGKAFIGALLLAISTSLPEVATVVTAIVFLDNPTLAIHNLLGAVALQVGILIVADIFTHKKGGALTFFSPDFALLIEGVGLLILLQLVIAGVTAGGVPLLGTASIWSVLVFLTYLIVLYLTKRYEMYPQWKPTDNKEDQQESKSEGANINEDKSSGRDGNDKSGENRREEGKDRSMKHLWFLFAGFSLLVLIAGWGVAQSADVLASQTGLGSAFLGATLLALATSQPELSTSITASRNKQYSMAISNIFGSSAFNISLLFLAELLYYGDTIVQQAQEQAMLFIASIGAIMTCIYLWGLMEREDRTIFGIGWDSAANLFIYLGGMVVLYLIS